MMTVCSQVLTEMKKMVSRLSARWLPAGYGWSMPSQGGCPHTTPTDFPTPLTGSVHQAGGTRKGKRDQSKGGRGVCYRKGVSVVHSTWPATTWDGRASAERCTVQAKIVRQETTNIDALYSRKRKQVEIQKKM